MQVIKILIDHQRVLMGEYYINNDSKHQKNERVHAIQGLELMLCANSFES
jgi:hypothetical protein